MAKPRWQTNDMNEIVLGGMGFVFSLVPYVLVAWGYAKFTDGGQNAFWVEFGLLVAARLFFAIIEGLGGVLAWRLHGKNVAVGNFLRCLRANNFPERYFKHDDFLNYLSRVIDDHASPATAKQTAKCLSGKILNRRNRL